MFGTFKQQVFVLLLLFSIISIIDISDKSNILSARLSI